MIRIWQQGRDVIDEMMAANLLERVTASEENAEHLVEAAARHVESARILRDSDVDMAFSAAYDASRKTLTAILAIQGLRPKAAGGHIVVIDAVLAQLDPPLGATIKNVHWMRRLRNGSEYPSFESPGITPDDVDEAAGYAEDIIRMARTVLPNLPPY